MAAPGWWPSPTGQPATREGDDDEILLFGGAGWLDWGLSWLFVAAWIAPKLRMLQAGLPGYADYARQVRYRLIPGLW
jgi:hypothetical protein